MQMQISAEAMEDVAEAIRTTGHNEAVIKLKDDRWMVTAEGSASVILAAVLVPEQVMEVYDRNGYESVGVKLDKILKFSKRTNSELVNMWMEKRTLHIEENDGNAHVELATLDVDSVTGRTDKSLNVEHEVKFTADFDFITDFIRQTEDIINSDHFFIGGRENGLYLYSEHDNGRMDDFYPWDDLEDVQIDWEVDNWREMGHRPKDDHAVDVILGSDFTKELYHPKDEAFIGIGNHFPMKILYEMDNGMMISYFQTPRIPTSEDTRTVIPDRVIDSKT